MKVVVCIERLEVYNIDTKKNSIFREGETYLASMANPNFWVVDSLGVKSEDFALHFEVVDEITPTRTFDSVTDTNRKYEEEKEFKELLRTFGYTEEEEEDEEEEQETWLEKVIDYIFA